MQSIDHWRNDICMVMSMAGLPSTSTALASRALQELPGPALLKVDQACRRRGDWRQGRRTHDPARLTLPRGESRSAVESFLFLAGCNPSGFVRQQAVQSMAEYPSPLGFALWLIRCADWVAPVRHAAERALRHALSHDPAKLFEHVELVARLLEHERFAETAWPEIVSPILSNPAHADLRWSAFDAGGGKHRTLVIDLILRADPDRAQALVLRALGTRDPVIARWALRALAQRDDRTLHDASDVDDAIALGLQHPNAGVRVEALRLRATRAPAGLADLLREQLLSPLYSMRNLAAFLSPQTGIDAMQVWRDAVDDPACREARNALASLCERAMPIDFDRIAAWTSHDVAEARRHALIGLAKADIERATPWLKRALASSSPKEVRVALTCGQRANCFLTRETLIDAYRAATAPESRRLIVDATRMLWSWDRLDALLDIAETRDGPLNPDLANALRYWNGAPIGKLDPQRKASLLARTSDVSPRLPDVDWARIRAILENS